MDTRVCSICEAEKPTKQFHVRQRQRMRAGAAFTYTWVSTQCKACEHAARQVYRHTPEGQLVEQQSRQRYAAKPETKALRQAYWDSTEGKAVRTRYDTSQKGAERRRRYLESEKGQANQIERWARHSAKRRILEKDQADVSLWDWKALLYAYQSHCAYCDRDDMPMTIDHIVPLSKGGKNVWQNVVPACNSCNQTKSASTDQSKWTPRPPRLEVRLR